MAARPLIRFSSARARPTQSAAPILSKTASASSSVARASLRRLTRRCAAPSASSVRARSSGSSTFACHRERLRVRRERSHRGPRLGRQQPSTAQAGSEGRGTFEPARVSLVPAEKLHRLLAPAELDQRFDVVDNEADGRRLDDRLTAYEFERWIKTCDHPFRGHGCVLGMADRRRGHELDVPAPPSSQLESAIGSVLRLLDPAQLSMGEAL